MSVRHAWRKNLNHCNSFNEFDVNLPTPMPKLQSPINEPTTHSNHVSLQSHSLPLSDSCNTNIVQASIPPSINQSQTQTLFPHSLINPHVASVLHAQTLLSPQGNNHIQPPLPPSPRREMLMNDINQLQDLSNTLAMHLSQCNNSLSPYSPNLPHTINLDQVEQHVGYCPLTLEYVKLNQPQAAVEKLLSAYSRFSAPMRRPSDDGNHDVEKLLLPSRSTPHLIHDQTFSLNENAKN
uniref:Uncharacterized protein n=1 Tax=Tanacetum cinerariifolium TaxID=118510 RepID=A0A6L2K5S8_TANCI|nr:hypothetical protein [Tanacetum cinerariifolium]